jgi:peptidyl-prolyl cis-trans isomerase SurA
MSPSSLIASLALVAAGIPALATAASDGPVLDRIVAVVDDGVVLKSELDAQTQLIVSQLRGQGTRMPPVEVLQNQVLETLVLQEVQLQRADRLGIRVGDEQLNATLQRIAASNGLTLSQLPAAMAQDGVDYRSFREQVRREMMIEALRQRDVVAKIAVSEREIQRWLEQEEASVDTRAEFDISQILVALPQGASADQSAAAEAKVNELHTRLLNGEDFAELAVAESEGQQALTGGSLGWRKANQIPPAFAEVIVRLPRGGISEPVRSASGWHIFKVNDIRGGEEKVVEMQSHARHILLRPNEILDEEGVRAQLERLRGRILEGESFEDIARLESEDPGTAAVGGDLGWNPPGTFVPEFERQMELLKPGEISEPFKSPFGWHIVQLIERGERDTTEELRRRRAIQAIRASKQEQETDLWLRRLRDEAWVEIRG